MTAAVSATTGVAVLPTTLLVITSETVGNDRSGFDNSSSTFGSLSPTALEGQTCVRLRHAGVGGGDDLSLRLDNTGIAQDLFKSVRIIGTNWDVTLETADADAFNDNDGGRTTWRWDFAHSVMVDAENYNAYFT